MFLPKLRRFRSSHLSHLGPPFFVMKLLSHTQLIFETRGYWIAYEFQVDSMVADSGVLTSVTNANISGTIPYSKLSISKSDITALGIPAQETWKENNVSSLL